MVKIVSYYSGFNLQSKKGFVRLYFDQLKISHRDVTDLSTVEYSLILNMLVKGVCNLDNNNWLFSGIEHSRFEADVNNEFPA